jgi:hypothetical protein
MAKALFHKGQRVYVKSVGTWAAVERVAPHWVSGVEEPLRVYYEVGLGRTFAGHELAAAGGEERDSVDPTAETWRVRRLRAARIVDGAGDSHGDTYPAVVTEPGDWGGWRPTEAEFERDPERIELQARMICASPAMLRAVRALVAYADDADGESLTDAIEHARAAHRLVYLDHGNDPLTD